jgi:hypothetical protein
MTAASSPGIGGGPFFGTGGADRPAPDRGGVDFGAPPRGGAAVTPATGTAMSWAHRGHLIFFPAYSGFNFSVT